MPGEMFGAVMDALLKRKYGAMKKATPKAKAEVLAKKKKPLAK